MLSSKKIFFLATLLLLLTGCRKETHYITASDQLVNKVWYLEKIVSSSHSYSYTGLPTFSFTLEKSTYRYHDSDGIMGDFIIQELPQGIWIQVNSPTRLIESYKIVQLEKNHFVAEIVKNNVLQILYFSIRP